MTSAVDKVAKKMVKQQLFSFLYLFSWVLLRVETTFTTATEERRAREVCKGLLRSERYAPGFVRLAFHDCVGGCNGCVDLMNPANKGLEAYIEPLNEVWELRRVREYMSRADFWALCGIEAVIKAFKDGQVEGAALRQKQLREREGNARRTNGITPFAEEIYPNTSSPMPKLTAWFGRVDCHPTISNQSAANTFPDSHAGLNDTVKYFQEHFGFNTRETVALLGAHTLGDAKADSSGFEGIFTEHTQWLDNAYYRDLIKKAPQWKQVNMRQLTPWLEPKWQWTRPAKNGKFDFVMLNADVCLVRDMKPDSKGRVNSTYQHMQQSATYQIVEEFANNNALWVQEFAEVFTKMLDKRWPGVQLRTAKG